MNITSILFSMFGTLIGYRILLEMMKEELIDRQNFRRALTIWVFVLFFCVQSMSPSSLIVIFLMVLFVPHAMLFAILHHRQKKAALVVRALVDELLLSMRAGHSLREGLRMALNRQDADMMWMKTIISSDGLHQSVPSWLMKDRSGVALRRVLDLEHAQTKIIDQLLSLRRTLVVAGKLHRKVQSAANPAKVQGLMVLMMYFSACVFQMWSRPEFLRLQVFWISFALMVSAGFAMRFLLRGFRWSLCRGS